MSDLEYHQTPRAVVPTAGDEPESSLIFGVTLQVGTYTFPVSSDDLANMKKKGIDLRLPAATRLGTIADLTTWVKDNLGVTLPAPDDFPPPLNGIFDRLSSLVWTVNQAHLKVPGTEPANQPTLYTLVISAAWDDEGIPIIPGVLSIKGGVVGVTNEPSTAVSA